jgi:hypothetical protein
MAEGQAPGRIDLKALLKSYQESQGVKPAEAPAVIKEDPWGEELVSYKDFLKDESGVQAAIADPLPANIITEQQAKAPSFARPWDAANFDMQGNQPKYSTAPEDVPVPVDITNKDSKPAPAQIPIPKDKNDPSFIDKVGRYLGDMGESLIAGTASAASSILKVPQLADALYNLPYDIYAKAIIKNGNIPPETRAFLLKNYDTIVPRPQLGSIEPATKQGNAMIQSAKSPLVKDLDEFSEGMSKRANENLPGGIFDYLKKGQIGKAVGKAVLGAVESLPATLVAAGAGPAGLAGMGITAAAQQYDQLDENSPQVSDLGKTLNALGYGAFEVLTEEFGTKEMSEWIHRIANNNTPAVAKEIFKEGVGQVIAKAYKTFGLWFAPVHEGLSEVINTTAGNLISMATGEKEWSKDNFTEGLFDSFAIGGATGSGFAAIGAISKKLQAPPTGPTPTGPTGPTGGATGPDQGTVNTSTGPLNVPGRNNVTNVTDNYDQEHQIEVDKITSLLSREALHPMLKEDAQKDLDLLNSDPLAYWQEMNSRVAGYVDETKALGQEADPDEIADFDRSSKMIAMLGGTMNSSQPGTTAPANQNTITQQPEAKPVPVTPEEKINSIGQQLKFSRKPLAEDPDPKMTFVTDKNTGKVYAIKEADGAESDAFHVAYDVDELKANDFDFNAVPPVMMKPSQFSDTKEVPYQEWLNNELQQYSDTEAQINHAAAQEQSQFSAGQPIAYKGQNYNVLEVMPQGEGVPEETLMVENENGEIASIPQSEYQNIITENGNATAPVQSSTEPVNAVIEPVNPVTAPVQATGQPVQQAKIISDGKNDYTMTPDENGNYAIDQTWDNEQDATKVLETLQKKRPRANFTLVPQISQDPLEADQFKIVSIPQDTSNLPIVTGYNRLQSSPATDETATATKTEGQISGGQGQAPNLGQEPTYQQKKQIVLDTFGGSYEEAAKSSPARIYQAVPEVGPEEAAQIHAEIKAEFEAEQAKVSNVPGSPFGFDQQDQQPGQDNGEIKFAKHPDGTLKNKEDYTPNEWVEYTKSVIESKENQARADQATQRAKDNDALAQKYGFENAKAAEYPANNWKSRHEEVIAFTPHKKGWAILNSISTKESPSGHWFAGSSLHIGDSGHASGPSQYSKPYNTEKEAIGAELVDYLKEIDEMAPRQSQAAQAYAKKLRAEVVEYQKKYPAPKGGSAVATDEQAAQVDITAANDQVDGHPSDAQKKAGNATKGHVTIQGMPITLENAPGTIRSGTDSKGKKWSTMMNHSYGYFKRTKGKDGDQVDVFVGNNPASTKVFVVDQVDPKTGKFDEHKVMLGFNSEEEAREGYHANYDPDWKGLGAMTEMPVEQFKEWLGDGTRTKKPVKQKPKVKRPAFTARELRAMEQTPNSFEEEALQFFIGKGKVKTDDVIRYAGYERGSEELRKLQFFQFISDDGVSLDVFHQSLQNGFEFADGGQSVDMVNAIIDILHRYRTKWDMVKALERSKNIDGMPDHMLPSDEELEAAQLEADQEANFPKVNKVFDDFMDTPDVKIILQEYTNKNGLDVDKLLNDIEFNPEIVSNLTPFGLSADELLKLKTELQNEQANRRGSTAIQSVHGPSVPESQSGEENNPGDTGKHGGELEKPQKEAWGQSNKLVSIDPKVLKNYEDLIKDVRGENAHDAWQTISDKLKSLKEFKSELPEDHPMQKKIDDAIKLGSLREHAELYSWHNIYSKWIMRLVGLKYPIDIKTLDNLTSPTNGFGEGEKESQLREWYSLLQEDFPALPSLPEGTDALLGYIKDAVNDKLPFNVDDVVNSYTGGSKYNAETRLHDRRAAKEAEQAEPAEGDKEPWQMTPAEYVNSLGSKDIDAVAIAKAAHPKHVKAAIEDGKKVPLNVLEEYKSNNWASNEINKQKIEKPAPVKTEQEKTKDLWHYFVALSQQKARQARIKELEKNPSASTAKELRTLKLIEEQEVPKIEEKLNAIDKTIDQSKLSQIQKLVEENLAVNDKIGDRIIDTQKKRDRKEKELQGRNGVFGDNNADSQDMFAGDFFEPKKENLQAALKPFNDTIEKSIQEMERNDQLLQQKITDILKGNQQEIKYDNPEPDQIKGDKKEPQQEYRYKMALRPFSVATHPKEGFLRYEPDEEGHGTIIYDHKLDPKVWDRWSLLPIQEIEEAASKVWSSEYYEKIQLKPLANGSIEVSMYEKADSTIPTDKVDLSAKELFTNINDGYFKEAKQPAKDEFTPPEDLTKLPGFNKALAALHESADNNPQGFGIDDQEAKIAKYLSEAGYRAAWKRDPKQGMKERLIFTKDQSKDLTPPNKPQDDVKPEYFDGKLKSKKHTPMGWEYIVRYKTYNGSYEAAFYSYNPNLTFPTTLKTEAELDSFTEQLRNEPATPPPTPTSTYGQDNKVVKTDAAAAARERNRKRLNNLNMGMDLGIISDGMILGAYHIEASARTFAEFAQRMINELGINIKPYLKIIYNSIRDWHEYAELSLESYDIVSKFDLETIKPQEDVSDRPGDSERDSQDSADDIPGDQTGLPDGGGGSGSVGNGNKKRGGGSGGRRSGKGNRSLFGPAPGERGDNGVHPQDEDFWPEDGDAGDFDGRGDDIGGTGGHDITDEGTGEEGEIGGERISGSFQERTRLKKIEQKKAESIPVKLMDEANVRETLPLCLPEQQDDVLKAEKRFFGEEHKTKELANGKGMLFTNGTGTGKTYSGLGIIKRFAKQGKTDILIVVPSEAKINDWIKEAASFGLNVSVLKNTKDKGQGICVTTYASFRANDNLKNRDLDLIMYDESHRLMEDKHGKSSATTSAHYLHGNITPSQAFNRISSVHPLWVEQKQLNELVRQERKSTNNLDLMDWQLDEIRTRIKKYDDRLDVLKEKIKEATPALEERAKKAFEKTKVVFLSATPFKTHFNLRYANGSLFDWGNETTYEPKSRGQSRVDPEGRFFLDNFGGAYEWKNNNLQTRSNASAEAIAMQEIAFAEKLMAQGVMSGRAIESNMDYSREFPLVALDNADLINQGFSEIFTHGEGGQFQGLQAIARDVFFDYNYTTQLFESLRASMSIPRIGKHLEMGRKVVVFHRRKQANVEPPFALILRATTNNCNGIIEDDTETPEHKETALKTLAEIDAFAEKFADLLEYEKTLNYTSAIDQIVKAFGDRVVLLNGDTPKKDKSENIRKFNDDNSGVDILVVQEEAGKEGISLHDTTGKHQRVIMNMSLPQSSTTALQIEGRIFRIGQETDAIFEYPILGLDMEIAAFGNSINRKLSTTENLAVGNQARDLIRSFAEGVLFNSKKDDPTVDQGKGGKEYDKREVSNVSRFRKAVLVYNTNQRIRGKRDERAGTDFFPTPEPLGQKMTEWLDLREGDQVLEPSAGNGAIAMWFPETGSTTVVEPSYTLFSRLNVRAAGGTRRLINQNFEDLDLVNKFDGIAMNPPFGAGGKMAMDHVAKAFKHLRDGGRLVAIIPNGGMMDKRWESFVNGTDLNGKLLNPDVHLVATIKLPRITFEQAGTAVSCRVVIVDKVVIKTKAQFLNEIKAEQMQALLAGRYFAMNTPLQIEAEAQRRFSAQYDNLPQSRNIEMDDVKTVSEFFDELEDMNIAKRNIPEKPVETEKPIKQYEDISQDSASEFKLETIKHSRTGQDLFVAKPKKRLDWSEYDIIRKKAEKNAGYYSRFVKGFVFSNDDNRQKFIAEATSTNVEEKKGKYTTTKGEVIHYKLAFGDEPSSGNNNVQQPGDPTTAGRTDRLTNPALRKLNEGEYSSVERKYRANKGFTFTGNEKIESYDDVAYLFRSLEDQAVENVFYVYVKNGKPIIQHISIGSPYASVVWHLALADGIKRFNPDAVYIVHNHPSGALNASASDYAMLNRAKEAFGDNLIKDGVILNIDSGKYGLFSGGLSDIGTRPITGNNKAFTTLSFNKQVFNRSIDQPEIKSVANVASVLSAQRLSDGDKLSLLVLDTGNKVTANIHLPYSSLSNPEIARDISAYVARFGGVSAIIYGRSSEFNSTKTANSLKTQLAKSDVTLLDLVSFNYGTYESAAESGVLEDYINYAKDDPSQSDEINRPDKGANFRVINDLYLSTVSTALIKVKQEKATAEQWKAMLLNGGAKQAELDWMGWDDRFPDAGMKVNKLEIAEWIGKNKIGIKEVKKGTYSEERKWQRNGEIQAEFEAKGFNLEYEGQELVVVKNGETIYEDDWKTLPGNLPALAKEHKELNREWEDGDAEGPKFGSWVMPGGEDYKELLLTMPVEDKFNRDLVKIVRHLSSATQGTTEVFYDGKRIASYGDNPKLMPSGNYEQETEEEWINVVERLYYHGSTFGSKPISNKSFHTRHWDEANIVAHTRFNTRTTTDGKNILFLEEVQSDWGQKGKKEGFASPLNTEQAKVKVQEIMGRVASGELTQAEAMPMIESYTQKISTVPNMPFKNTDQWAGLAFRRMIRYAIDNGFDAIAWTPGQVQAERYSLINHIDAISYNSTRAGTYNVVIYRKPGTGADLIQNYQTPAELENTIGKELTQKIVNGEYTEKNGHLSTLKGLDLKVGGAGMKAFYDQILPSIANKLGKKFGTKVETTYLPDNKNSQATGYAEFSDGVNVYNDEGAVVATVGTVAEAEAMIVNSKPGKGIPVQSLPISPAMFESYRQGVPLYKSEISGESLMNDVLGTQDRAKWDADMTEKVQKIATSLNSLVNVVKSKNDLPEHIKKQAKRMGIWNQRIGGVYDQATDSVYVVLDGIHELGEARGLEEVTKTILHEVVAHKGLPFLLGQAEYNNFLDELYKDIPVDDENLIRRDYNTSDKRTIAEEYLGSMAEENVNPSLYQRVLAKIRQMLRRMFKVSFTSNDIHDMLRRSKENLRKQNAGKAEFAEEYLNQGAKFKTSQTGSEVLDQANAEYNKPIRIARNLNETIKGFREYIQDIALPLRDMEQEFRRRGAKQDNASKPYRDLSLAFGRYEELYRKYMEDKMDPVLNTISWIVKEGMPRDAILPYIISKHGLERNPAFRKRELAEWNLKEEMRVASERAKYENANQNLFPADLANWDITMHVESQKRRNAYWETIKNKDYSGIKPFDVNNKYENPEDIAQEIVDAFESMVDENLINNLWTNIRGASEATLDTWESGNQISNEQKQDYLAQFKHFVPLRGWREDASKDLDYTQGDGKYKSLIHAKGRGSLADNPLAYMVTVQAQALSEQVDNEVKNSMLNLIVKNLHNNEIHDLATLKKLYYVRETLADGTDEWVPTIEKPSAALYADKRVKTKVYREHEKVRTPKRADAHEVMVRREGGDYVMVFPGKGIKTAQTLNKENYTYRSLFGGLGDTRKGIHGGIAALGPLNNTLKALYTSWNVIFPFTNFLRDAQEAPITHYIKTGSNPLGGEKGVYSKYKSSFGAITRRMFDKHDLSTQVDQDLEDFYTFGGATGYTHSMTTEDIEKKIIKQVKRAVRDGQVPGKMLNTLIKVGNGVEMWNGVFEDATRFSIYRASLAAGMTKKDAAYEAKEASVNFNRKGKGSKAWDAWFAFFNVAVQSLQKNFKLAKDYPARFAGVAGSFVAIGFFEAMMNAFSDDDDDDSSYYNISEYMRENFLIIPNLIGMATGKGKGDKYLSIPLPQFWRGFKSLGAIGFDVMSKRMTLQAGMVNAMTNFAAGMTPIDIGGFYQNGEFSTAPLFPTIVKPWKELADNKNYMGYAIVKEPFTKDQEKKLANAGLGKTNVSPAAKFFTDILFRSGGGDNKTKFYYKDGKWEKVFVGLDINPSAVEHIMKGYSGGTGGMITDMITTAYQGISPETEVDFKNMPFVNKFIRKTPEAKWNIIADYYNLKEEAGGYADLTKIYESQASEGGTPDKYNQIASDQRALAIQDIFASYDSDIKELSKDKVKDDVASADQIIVLMKQCLDQVNQYKKAYGQ